MDFMYLKDYPKFYIISLIGHGMLWVSFWAC